uniref:BZIP domain-containing protein n=1 Tax=Panagrolaimus sp. JU765 TaxID=591449 RepID=A0AC34QBQ2_9BILA
MDLSNGTETTPEKRLYKKTRKRQQRSEVMASTNKKIKEEKVKLSDLQDLVQDLEGRNTILAAENDRLVTENHFLKQQLKNVQNICNQYKSSCIDAENEAANSDIVNQILSMQTKEIVDLQERQQMQYSAKIYDLLQFQKENMELRKQLVELEQMLARVDMNTPVSTAAPPSETKYFISKSKPSNSAPRAGEILKNGFLEFSMGSFCESSGIAKARMRKGYQELDQKHRRERVNDSLLSILINNDPRCDPTSMQSRINALPFMSELAKCFDCVLRNQKLSEADTAYVYHMVNLSRDQSRELRRVLNSLSPNPKASYNIFASDHKVGDFRTKFGAEIDINIISVGPEDDKREFAVVANFIDNLKSRLQRLVDCNNFQYLPEPFSNEIWSAVGGDYGGGYMKFTNSIGNIEKRNDPNSISLIAMGKGKSTKEHIFEALHDIANQIKSTSEIQLIIENVPTTFNVRWFLEGDIEFLLDMTGKKSASSKHPCFYCFFKKDQHSFLRNPESLKPSKKRTDFVDRDTGETLPLFNIPPHQLIAPCLHIFLGIGQRFISTLEFELKKMDYEKLTPEERERFEAEDAEISEKSEAIRSNLVEKTSELELLRSEVDGLQQLNDYIFSFLEQRRNLNNSAVPGDCQMEFCVARAGFGIEDKYRNCNCQEHSDNPKRFHEFCLGFLNSKKTLTCQNVTAFGRSNGLAKNIPAMLSQKLDVMQKAEQNIQKLQTSYQKELLKRFVGDNVKELENIFRSMKVTRQLYFHEFTGNHIHRILKNTHFFLNLNAYENNNVVRQIITALKFLGKVQSFTRAEFLTEDDKENLEIALDDFKKHKTENFPNESMFPKLHILWHHFAELAEMFGTIGYFTEQGVESIHHIVNANLLPRASFLRGTNQLKWMLIQHYISNCFNDSRRN